ncbi:MAG: exopolyphosphatase [Xanthomonadales bacterium]|nr:exopolyphosphatase [Xanthomonadales bacterium]
MADKFRLVTRSDFDGLVCAVLLKELDLVDEIVFVHPKDMQDGKVDIGPNDITTNLPYVPSCHLCFDHHSSEITRTGGAKADNYIIDPDAPSAARVVFEHYGGRDRFTNIPEGLMVQVDKADSAHFSEEDVLFPEDWVLLSFLMDSRTGLGLFKDFRISNYDLMMQLISACRDHNIDEILDMPDVRERKELYFAHQDKFKEQLHRCAEVHDNLVVLDLRDEEVIYAGNRFVIYALYPQCNVSMHVLWGVDKQTTVFAIGASIYNRTCKTNIGELCLARGGGGHRFAGTCQIPTEDSERVKQELIKQLTTIG